MNMVQGIAEAARHPKDEFTATMKFVMKRNRSASFAYALGRIMGAKISVDWEISEQHALLNMAYIVKVTGTGWQISKIIEYFAACGFSS